MIKKYYIETQSVFNKSIILSLFEPGDHGFHIDGLTDSDKKDLFPVNRIKYVKNEIDFKNIPTQIVVAYFEEDILKAFILKSSSNKYYLFKVDHQKELQLNIHQKYISNDLSFLMNDYEKHLKIKGKNNYEGEGDSSHINERDYFEDKYKNEIKNKVDKESNLYRLTFDSNNLFTADFVDLIDKKKIKISNKNDVDDKVFTLSTMSKNRHDRKDCLLINSETKDIEYLIFTYKPHFIKHYFLLKKVGEDTFEFIKESICFNYLFHLDELKDIRFKNGSKFASKSFAKMRYDNFYLEYVAFEEEEEFDEELQTIVEPVIDEKAIRKEKILLEVLEIIKNTNMPLDIGVTYHGKERILERIGEMSENEMLSLAKVAYEKGKTSGHYIEKDPVMFKFLQYQQNKKIGKTLRFYNDILFFYTLEPPHSLVTCFPYKNNFELYSSNEKKRK